MDKRSWLDFASTAQRMAAAYDKNVAGKSQSASSGPTAAEIRDAKNEAVGGKPKRCRIGKNCSAACIAQNDDCLVDFPEPVQNEIRKMVQFVLKKGNIEPGSEEDVKLGKAAIMVGQHLSGKSKSGEAMFPTTAPGQSRLLSLLEIADLKANRDKIGQAEFDERVRKSWQKDVQSRGMQLDRKSLELIYDALPQSAKNQMAGSGNPGAGKWYAVDKDGNETTTGKSKSRERGLAFLDMYFKQGGTDAYGRSARVFSPADFDVEHIRPMSKGGIDHPSNWVLARSGAQRQRAEQELGAFIDRLPNPRDREAVRRYYSEARSKSLAKEAAKTALRSADPYSMEPSAIARISPNQLKYMFAGPSGGKDTFFSNSLIGAASTGTRPSSALPAPIGKLYGLARRTLPDSQVEQIRTEVRRAWNKEWSLSGGSTQSLISSVLNSFQSRLSPEVYSLVAPEVEKWAQGMLSKYPNGKPQ